MIPINCKNWVSEWIWQIELAKLYPYPRRRKRREEKENRERLRGKYAKKENRKNVKCVGGGSMVHGTNHLWRSAMFVKIYNIQYIFFVCTRFFGFYTPIFPESLHVVTSGSEKNGIHIWLLGICPQYFQPCIGVKWYPRSQFKHMLKLKITDHHILHGILRFIIVNGAKCSWQGCICFARCNKMLTLQRNIATAD